jgi:hypothetical protein
MAIHCGREEIVRVDNDGAEQPAAGEAGVGRLLDMQLARQIDNPDEEQIQQ